MPRDITFFAATNFRGEEKKFGIYQQDRLSHFYILGKTGTGKTTLIDTMLRQDILAGRGCALLDPHGDLATSIYTWLPPSRRDDLIYINLPDKGVTWGYNPLTRVNSEYRSLVASGVMDVFKKLWGDGKSWGVKMEHILRNTLLTLLDQPRATFDDIPRILTDKTFRTAAIKHLDNEAVSAFWKREFEAYSKISRTDAISPILNKVGGFLSDPRLRRFLVENKKTIRLRQVMDSNKILLINLAQGEIGRDASALCGSLLTTALGLAAFSRASISEKERVPFYLYVDEFHNFSTLSFASLFSELRKYKLAVVAANQFTRQLEPETRDAVLGNVGTLVSFRTGPNDARYLSREFCPVFSEADILCIPNFHCYLKLMIDGAPSKPFSASGLRFKDVPNL